MHVSCPHARRGRARLGFTLLELMLVVGIIGLLSTMAIPNFVRMQKNARVARTATEIKGFATAFVAYKAAYGEYPPDSHIVLPPGMDTFIDPGAWGAETPIGGTYNWEGPDFYPYAGISLFNSTAASWQIDLLDTMLDDGDLDTGSFRRGTGGRPTYVIEE